MEKGVRVEFINNSDLRSENLISGGGRPLIMPQRKNTIRIILWNKPHTLSHFRYYRVPLAILHKQMMDWRPQGLKDLFIVGYADRFTYYTTLFGIGIATLGIIGIIAAIVQTIVAFLALNAS